MKRVSIIVLLLMIGAFFVAPAVNAEEETVVETATELEERGFVADEAIIPPKVSDPVLQIPLPSESLKNTII